MEATLQPYSFVCLITVSSHSIIIIVNGITQTAAANALEDAYNFFRVNKINVR